MRLVFFGTGLFAVPILRALVPHVVLVVAQPARPSGRGLLLHPSPVKVAALELGLDIETPKKCSAAEFVAKLAALEADALVVASYGQILSEDVLDSAKRGGINLHGSILPKYRGAAPIQRAILADEAKTGVTLMQMDKGMDTGDIIAIEKTPIGPDETYSELQDRLAAIAATMATEWLPRVVSGEYPRVSQDHAESSLAPKVRKEEAELRFEARGTDEYNRFRAFTDTPGAFFRTRLGSVRLHRARFDPRSGAAGTLLALDPFPVVAFQSGSLALAEVQPEGKKRMGGRDFANGLRLKAGMSLKDE